MKKFSLFFLVTSILFSHGIYAGKKKEQTKDRTFARDIKRKLADNPGQFGDTHHQVYYSYPLKTLRNQ
ncbi:MAG TPA: hypothetical protein VLG50_04820 [Candidatus Saccharimonadales bacterium]|nr:hypothetical protein [Candidatus Saccharimonadales bacterium]